MKVTTLTIEDPAGQVVTTVHYDECAARATLRADYGGPDLDDVSEDDLIQTLIDDYGLVIYIAEHDVPEPAPKPEPVHWRR